MAALILQAVGMTLDDICLATKIDSHGDVIKAIDVAKRRLAKSLSLTPYYRRSGTFCPHCGENIHEDPEAVALEKRLDSGE